MTTLSFDGVPVHATTPPAAAGDLLARAASDDPAVAYRLINAYSLALADRDAEYRQLLLGPGVNLPDGLPLAKVLAWTAPSSDVQQVRGPALFEACLDTGRAAGVRHYLLGSTDATLNRLVDVIGRRFPGAEIVGVESPPFRALTDNERRAQAGRIRDSDADVVWVALGTPKQDFEAAEIVRATGKTCAAVGAAFDFTAGTVAAAPPWMRRVGLEWLFRFASEPRRLWRRYLFGNVTFLRISVRHAMQSRRAKRW